MPTPQNNLSHCESSYKEQIQLNSSMGRAQWYFSQKKYETIPKNGFELIRCIYLDCPSNFKLFRSKNRSKISIFGGVMKMYILTAKLGYFFNFRSSIFPKFANFRNQILLYAKPILARILKIYATYQH